MHLKSSLSYGVPKVHEGLTQPNNIRIIIMHQKNIKINEKIELNM
jgi:hypothetical protein